MIGKQSRQCPIVSYDVSVSTVLMTLLNDSVKLEDEDAVVVSICVMH